MREECLHFVCESELRKAANQSITCARSAVAVKNKVYIKDFTAWFVSPSGEVTAVFIKLIPTLYYVFRERFLFPFVERLIFGNKHGCCTTDSPPIIRDL